MPTDTATQGWDSRFDDSTATISSSLTGVSTPKSEASSILQKITITVRNELPFIQPNYLKLHSRLGQGSSFEVTQEVFSPLNVSPYFVAVKRILMETASTETWDYDTEWHSVSKRLANVMREVRILTHPKLRSHTCLVSAIGWGWAPDPLGADRPYIVMPYSDSGTLRRFAQKRVLSIADRRLLALDVALGLRALHENRIIHGDVKPENVLVFDYSLRNEDHERHYLAKLADFGCSLFEEDLVRTSEYYLGTAKYNAPEIRGLFREGQEEQYREIPRFDRFKAADCYSFGILLWETIKKGQSFIEPSWLDHGEHTGDFLEREFNRKANAFLDSATEFLQYVKANLATIEQEEDESLAGVLPSNPTRSQLDSYLKSWPHASGQLYDIDAPPDAESFQAFHETVTLCLQDDLQKRGSIQEIVRILSKGFRLDDKDQLSGWSSTIRYQPPTVSASGFSPLAGSQEGLLFGPRVDKSTTVRILRLDPKSSLNVKVVPNDTPPDPALQVVRVPPPRRSETVTVAPQRYQYDGEDMIKNAISRQPPWHVQCEAVDMIQRAVEKEEDPERSSQAKLQLAIMCKIGYGMPPENAKAMQYLREASYHNEVARAIYDRVHPIFDAEANQRSLISAATPEHVITRRNPLIFYGNVVWRDTPVEGDQSLKLGPISVASRQVLSILVKKGRYAPFEISRALTEACRDGLFDEALLLAKHCTDVFNVDLEMPNPLHWLIMFSPTEATQILRALVSAMEASETDKKLEGLRSLLTAEPELITVMLPHRCLKLHGNPLHWAVAAGYTGLCEAFIHLGADVNARYQWRRIVQEDSQHDLHPSLSPLDLAVASHHPQITKLLLDHGSELYGGDWHWEHSPLHMIGYDTIPFARHVMHGLNYRDALRETIKLLLDRGLDINALDSLDQTPLLRAVKSLDIEPYVLDELISAGATAVPKSEEYEGPLVSSATIGCAQRRFSAWKIPVLLPLTRDINAGSTQHRGLNALHHCAMFDAVPAADILLQTPGIDVNSESGCGDIAIILAAQRGSLGVLASLIRHGADLSRHGIFNNAISAGQIDAVAMLVNAGMSTRFEIRLTQTPRTVSVLHYAARHQSNRPSYIRKCLERCPRLREKDILNDSIMHNGATPLHNAACLGDLDGVVALLEAGADPLRLKADFVTMPHEKTALQVARVTKALHEDVTNATHPSLRAELDEIPLVGNFDNIRALEVNFVDRMAEIIRVLEQAERSWVKS